MRDRYLQYNAHHDISVETAWISMVNSWSPNLLQLTRDTRSPAAGRPFRDFPVGWRWPRQAMWDFRHTRTSVCLAASELSDDERDHRQQRPFEPTSLQVARTAVKMPSEQGHRLYVKYVRTEIPIRGGISKSRNIEIPPPCDRTLERRTEEGDEGQAGHEC
jgi:hypothetical protein